MLNVFVLYTYRLCRAVFIMYVSCAIKSRPGMIPLLYLHVLFLCLVCVVGPPSCGAHTACTVHTLKLLCFSFFFNNKIWVVKKKRPCLALYRRRILMNFLLSGTARSSLHAKSLDEDRIDWIRSCSITYLLVFFSSSPPLVSSTRRRGADVQMIPLLTPLDTVDFSQGTSQLELWPNCATRCLIVKVQWTAEQRNIQW
jgi:hypothetical protein